MTNTLNYNVDRVEKNLEVLKMLKSRHISSTELDNYSGWGGLREAVYTPDIYWKLAKILTEEEIKSIKQTFKSGYYTPKYLVDFIYQVILNLGFRPKYILEPSAGNGVFIERMPSDLRKNAEITAIEIDRVAFLLMKKTFGDIELHNIGFEFFQPEKRFDLVVGNPPFGQFYVEDQQYSDISEYSISHYFIAKSMRLLKENGVLAMILPRYFLDNQKKHVRQIIANEGGSLLLAYRLPDHLFSDAKVTVDVVFLKKVSGNKDWLFSKKLSHEGSFAYMNQYFLNHPTHVLGEIKFIELYGRTEITCSSTKTVMELLQQLQCIANLPEITLGQHCNNNQLDSISKETESLPLDYQQLLTIKENINRLIDQLVNQYKKLFT